MSLKIKVHHCATCEKNYLLASAYCPQCRSVNSFIPLEVEGKGKIFSYTVVYVSEKKWEADTPYSLVVIDLDGGVRVLGRMNGDNLHPLQIGMKVELTEYKDQVPVFKRVD